MPRSDLEPGNCPRCQNVGIGHYSVPREEDELSCETCGTRWTYAAPGGSLPINQQTSIRAALDRMRRRGLSPLVIYLDKSLATQLAFMEGSRTLFEVPIAETYVRGPFNAVVEAIERRPAIAPEIGSRWKHVTDATMFGIVHEVTQPDVTSLGNVSLLRARDVLQIPMTLFSALFVPDISPRVEAVAIGSSWNVGGVTVRVVSADEGDVVAVTTNGSRISLPLMSFLSSAKMIAEVPVDPPPWGAAAERYKSLDTYAREYPLTGRWQTAFSLSTVTILSTTQRTVTVEGLFEHKGLATQTFPIDDFRRKYQKIISTPAPTNGAFVRHASGGALFVVRGMEAITELICLEGADRSRTKITVERFSTEYRFVEADAYDLTGEGFEII